MPWILKRNARGTKVRRIQKALNRNSFAKAFGQGAGFNAGPVDGVMGPQTRAAIKRARYALGYANPTAAVAGYFMLAYLEKRMKLPRTYRKRRVARIQAYRQSRTHDDKLQHAINVWYAKRNQTHYSYPAHNLDRMKCPALPGVAKWTDCSGMIRCMWKQLGWPDPAGSGYNVWGNSDMMLSLARRKGKLIPRGSEQLGDIAVYVGGVGHAELVVSPGRVLTNGNEAGPYFNALGAHSGTLYICRLAPFA